MVQLAADSRLCALTGSANREQMILKLGVRVSAADPRLEQPHEQGNADEWSSSTPLGQSTFLPALPAASPAPPSWSILAS